MYETPVDMLEDLIGRIVEAAACVRHTPGIFEKVRNSMQRRCQACLDASGRNFEHHLQAQHLASTSLISVDNYQ